MYIILGSKNPTKLQSIELACKKLDIADYNIETSSVSTGVSEQPLGLSETITGAVNRAKGIHKENYIAIGLEGGLRKSEIKNVYMNIEVCAVYDGQEFYLGFAPGFENPECVTEFIDQGKDLSQAYYLNGLSKSENIGIEGGAIHFVTDGKLNRAEYASLAVQMAFSSYLFNQGLAK